jgi:hypothetical protein
MWEKAEVHSTKAQIANEETYRGIFNGCYTVRIIKLLNVDTIGQYLQYKQQWKFRNNECILI